MAPWDESAGRVSRAFDDWYLIDRDQRTFLHLGRRFATEVYDRLWKESQEEPGDPDGRELIDIFEAKVNALHQVDFDWMHSAGVFRDAVTNFEVYLEKAREEVLRAHGHAHRVPDHSPRWDELKEFFLMVGVEIGPEDVRKVRTLRHFLAHRRGELRTQKLREQFATASPDGYLVIVVNMSESEVVSAMDTLAAAVRDIDTVVYEYSWAGKRLLRLAR